MAIQWELLIFSMMIGLSMGTFVFLSYAEIKGGFEHVKMPAAIISLITLIIGGLASFFHLGHPERIFHILGNIRSGIAQELIVTAICGVVLVAYMFLLKQGEQSAKARRNIAYIGLIVGIIAPISTGKIYLLASRPAWNTLALPVMYLASALAMGALVIYLLAAKNEDYTHVQRAGKWALAAVGCFGAMVVVYGITIATAPYPHPSRSIARMLNGDLALLFWGAVIVIGLMIPGVLLWKFTNDSKKGAMDEEQGKKKGWNTAWASLVCIIIGSSSIRAIMYLMGTSIEQFFQ